MLIPIGNLIVQDLTPFSRVRPLQIDVGEAARSVRAGEARDGFTRRVVFVAGYRAATVAAVVGCPAFTVSRALQREAVARERR